MWHPREKRGVAIVHSKCPQSSAIYVRTIGICPIKNLPNYGKNRYSRFHLTLEKLTEFPLPNPPFSTNPPSNPPNFAAVPQRRKHRAHHDFSTGRGSAEAQRTPPARPRSCASTVPSRPRIRPETTAIKGKSSWLRALSHCYSSLEMH